MVGAAARLLPTRAVWSVRALQRQGVGQEPAITPAQVAALAQLSALELDEDATIVVHQEVTQLLTLVRAVQHVDTTALAPLHLLASQRACPQRPDVAAPVSVTTALGAASLTVQNFFAAPKVTNGLPCS